MRKRSRTEYSIMNMIAGLGGYALNTVLGFACRIVFTRYLAADYLGVNGLFTNILTMLSLAELGIGSAVVYALYKPLAERDEEKIAALVKLYGKAYSAVGVLIAVVGIALMPFLNVIIREQPNISESIYLLYLLNLFNTASTYFFSYRTSLIIADQRNYIVSVVNYSVTIIQSILQMAVLYLTHNYLGYLLIQTAGTFIFNATVSLIVIKEYPYIRNKNTRELSKEEKTSLFANVRDLMIYKISSLLVNSTDNILITFFKGLATTGIASNYTLLVNMLNALLGQVFNGLTASIGNHNAMESDENKYRMFSFMNYMNFWIFGWAALGIVFCSSDLVRLCFGQNYVLPFEIPLVMGINFFLVGMMNAVWTYKHTMGLFHYGRFLQIITGIINIIASLILGREFGLVGILFATILSRLFTSVWYDPYAVFLYGFHKSPLVYFRRYLYYLLIIGVTSFCNYIVLKQIHCVLLLQVFLRIIVCSVITNAVFWLMLHRLREYEALKHIIENVKMIIVSWIVKNKTI